MYLSMLWGRSALASSPQRSKGRALRAPRCEELFEKTRGGYGYCVPKELNLKQQGLSAVSVVVKVCLAWLTVSLPTLKDDVVGLVRLRFEFVVCMFRRLTRIVRKLAYKIRLRHKYLGRDPTLPAQPPSAQVPTDPPRPT